MTDEFLAANRARKKRAKWWREHIVLAYAVAIGIVMVVLLGVFAILEVPEWLAKLGVSPSGVELVAGTMWVWVGVWAIRKATDLTSVIAGVLCLLGGILALGRAFAIL
ncbi:MAG: hypothetical protein LAO22_10870 [Acidobacteriia bacterium]|nr:hypothetical protein [Terriglobia bacterium]